MGASPETRIVVAELTCTIPNCAPLETVIAYLDSTGAMQKKRILKPMVEVVEEDVVKEFAAPSEQK